MQAWHIFTSVIHLYKCDTFLQAWPIIQVWHIFTSVAHFYKCDTF